MFKKVILSLAILVFIPFCVYAQNDTTGQTWVLDTTGAVTTDWVDIVWIIWTGITTNDHTLVINETNNGKRIVAVVGRDGVDMLIPFPGNSGHLPSFYLQTLDSGTVQVRTGKIN